MFRYKISTKEWAVRKYSFLHCLVSQTGRVRAPLELMHIKGIILANVLLLVVVVFLSACTSSQVMSSGCDFVVGSAQSQQQQVQNLAIDSTDTNQEMNVINGLLQMLVGPINRSFSKDECTIEESENIYPTVVL